MTKGEVAAVKVRPITVLRDIERLCELANMRDALAADATTILKDNISWHYHEAGLGVGDPAQIHLVGDDVSRENWHFSVGENLASRAGHLLWYGRLPKLLFHTPLVKLFVLGSELYHDRYRWPVKDRSVFEAWQQNTEWGRLFASYASTSDIR